jgi:hypothetical protein
MRGVKLVKITKSTNKEKKLMAIFKIKNEKGNEHLKIVHFGAAGMSDYTLHRDPERKQRYINRHKKREYWDDPITAGSLSRYILWNKPSLRESIKDYKKRFNF